MRFLRHNTQASAEVANAAIYDRDAPPPAERETLYRYTMIDDPDGSEVLIAVDDESFLVAGEVASLVDEGALPDNLQDLLIVLQIHDKSGSIRGSDFIDAAQRLVGTQKGEILKGHLNIDTGLADALRERMNPPQQSLFDAWLAS